MCPSSIARDVYKLIKTNGRSKELRREKYEKIKELFKLVRECEKGDKAFNLNAEEVYETYNKVEEAYEETKKLEQRHTDLHEKMRELFKKKYNNYEEEILLVFNNSASEMERSYNRVLKKIDDKFKEDYEGGEETTKRERGEIFDILRKVITERLKKIQEVMDRTNKEVKRILGELDKLDKENIGMGAMLDLSGRLLEETKKELSFQFMSLKMLRYIKRHIGKIEAP